ncbi:MAG: ChrR family anti-sigma-E factor [Proteobacteria bacterium]|nr:ChrR family anti-sigma-E factor [Pseudomonadota bacterium]
MTIHHHPEDELIVAYAAGELDEAWSLLIATHAALCPACRSQIQTAEALGAALLEDIPPAEMATLADDAFEKTLARAALTVDDSPPVSNPLSAAPGDVPVLPQPLRGYAGGDVGSLKWRRLGSSAFHVPLVARRGAPTARLLRIPAGTAVPEHGHNGLELTMVLAGSFVDEGARFARGDVETADSDLEHQPRAEAGTDCICLAVTDAPLRFRGPIARLVQPFIGI